MGSNSYKNTQRWRHKAKLWIIRYGGNKCQCCGYDRYFGNLAYHHVDDTTKDEDVSKMINRCASWDSILKEVDKCVLVCVLCHGEIHAKLRTFEQPDLSVRHKEMLKIISEQPLPKCRQIIKCKTCGCDIPATQQYCSHECSDKDKEKISWPTNLLEMVNNSSKLKISKMLGVSDKAVAKRLKTHHGPII